MFAPVGGVNSLSPQGVSAMSIQRPPHPAQDGARNSYAVLVTKQVRRHHRRNISSLLFDRFFASSNPFRCTFFCCGGRPPKVRQAWTSVLASIPPGYETQP